jgi:hypothetical protein
MMLEESCLSRRKLQFQNKLRQLSTEKQRVAELKRLVYGIKKLIFNFLFKIHCTIRSENIAESSKRFYTFNLGNNASVQGWRQQVPLKRW